jgi:hypothetical protein
VSLLKRLYDVLLSPPDEGEPDDLVPVALPEGEETGALWQGILEDKGIPAMVRDISPLYRGYMNWAAECELLVRGRDLARAREILGVDTTGVLPALEHTARRP